jgi:hypothetical protein
MNLIKRWLQYINVVIFNAAYNKALNVVKKWLYIGVVTLNAAYNKALNDAEQ